MFLELYKDRMYFPPFSIHADRLIYLQGKQGVVKHLYMGILFIYNESESENCGFFCAQCGLCENVKKRKDLGGSTTENLVRIYIYPLVFINELEIFFVSLCFLQDNPIPMFAELSYEQNEHRARKCSLISSVILICSVTVMLPECMFAVLIPFLIQLRGLSGAPENNFSLSDRCYALKRVL